MATHASGVGKGGRGGYLLVAARSEISARRAASRAAKRSRTLLRPEALARGPLPAWLESSHLGSIVPDDEFKYDRYRSDFDSESAPQHSTLLPPLAADTSSSRGPHHFYRARTYHNWFSLRLSEPHPAPALPHGFGVSPCIAVGARCLSDWRRHRSPAFRCSSAAPPLAPGGGTTRRSLHRHRQRQARPARLSLRAATLASDSSRRESWPRRASRWC